MEVSIKETYEEMSELAARRIAPQPLRKPDSVTGLTTGSTSIGADGKLARTYREGGRFLSNDNGPLG